MTRDKMNRIFKTGFVVLLLSFTTFSGVVYGCIYIHDSYSEYIAINQIYDKKTEMVVELGVTPGRLANVEFYTIKIFKTKKENRKHSIFDIEPILIKKDYGVPYIIYDGNCYVIEIDGEADYENGKKEWSNFWGDKRLCFELRKRTGQPNRD